ncbi:myosin-11-like isoform X1 [Cynara cardunculus var. scolymus]|uniref:myosin-11-like isoform X1 n=3 Tax=Cynara cardunculus var. scolymus TaxID=59895 RepID=UPI000D62AF56|nr:myosin-11-like isoform X1 [Cynara cardunculus var. scolymus]XP_024990929.1 myosin-11-like isoform X1 [Cynara cardunculus var. scolymus]
MKEMMKQKMMNRFHKRNSSSSSSVDFKPGERLDFKFSSLQALQVPTGWDKLSLSLISIETDKTVSKTGKASVCNGNCRWTETLSESIWVSHDDASKELQQCLYKLLISKGSTRSSILGEVTVNLSSYLSSETSLPVALPLKKCDHGTILQVAIQCLTPRANLRWRDTNSLTEDVNSDYSDLDNMSDAPDGKSTRSVGSSKSNSNLDTSHARGLGSREASLPTVRSHHSFDSMEYSFGGESSRSNLSEGAIDLIGRPESTGSQNSTLYTSVNVYGSPRSNHSPFSPGSGKNILNRRQDSGKISHNVPASPLRTFGSSEFVMDAEATTPEELRAEARKWERNARKLVVDLDLSRKVTNDQTKNLENATMELSTLQTECNDLKHEIKHLKALLSESAMKERDADYLKSQVQDKNDIQAEMEEEIKFQKDLNNTLALQLEKTQESHLALVSVLQELEETIEKQRLEIKSLAASERPAGDLGMKLRCEHEDSGEEYTTEQMLAKKIKVNCDSDYENGHVEDPETDLLTQVELKEGWKLELELQKFQESQKKLESTILYLEKTLEEKNREIELGRNLKMQNLLNSELEWKEKLSLKDKDIFNLEAKLSQALAAPILKETESQAIENPELVEEVKSLKAKVLELERDCNELTEENLDLLYKLKELSKDLSTSGTSISFLLGERPSTESPSIEDAKVGKLECRTWQIKEEAKKMKPDEIASGDLQIRCKDLESKCLELEVQMQVFKNRACYLDSELVKYQEKAGEQETEIAALNQLLKQQQEEQNANSFNQEEQAAVVLDNVIKLNKSLENFCVIEDNIQSGEEEIKLTSKDPSHVKIEVDDSLKDKESTLEILIKELQSRVKDMDEELLAKTSETEGLKSDCLVKEEELQSQKYRQRDVEARLSDLQIVNNQLEESFKLMQREVDDTKDSHISGNKILEKKLLELESRNQELELHLAELEEDNLHLSGRISGLEPQLRYLTDARESSRLKAEHSESQVVDLQAEIRRLEKEVETTKFDMRQKVQDMQKRWLETQEECEYLKKANPKLEATTENLMDECSSLQKSNSELRQQRLELHTRCTVLEAELRKSQDNFLKLSKNLEDLEEKLSSMLHGIASKEKMLDAELDGLHLLFKEHTEKHVTAESLLNQMYSEKVAEVENLQGKLEHLSTQISATHDERDGMAKEAILEMHVLRADKDKLDNAIADVEGKLRSSEKKLDTIQVEYEKRILALTDELATSKQNHGVLVANHEKLMELLENTRSGEEKLKNTVSELAANLKSCEYERAQFTEENSSLKVQLQKIPVLQDEILALKNSLNDVKYENERLEASLQMISGDYQQLKEEKASLLQKASSMQKAVIELEDHKQNKIALEEKLLRLQGDLTAREALGAQDAELKTELGRLKRSNSQLQWKINRLQEEKDEYIKTKQALEEQKEGLKPEENEFATKNMAPFESDSTSSLHEDIKLAEDVEAGTVDEPSRIKSLEIALAEALEANEMYKVQLKSFLSEGKARESDMPVELEIEHKTIKHEDSSLEAELNELQERYLNMSLKYAEVEAQREELVLKLKAVGPGRSWFS